VCVRCVLPRSNSPLPYPTLHCTALHCTVLCVGWLVRKWLGLSADQQMIVGPYEFINCTNNTVEEVAVKVWWAFFQTLYLSVWVFFSFIAIAIIKPFYLIWPAVILITAYVFTIPGAGQYRKLIKDRVEADAAWNLSLGTVIEDSHIAQMYGRSRPLIKSFEEIYEHFYWTNRYSQLDRIYFENSSSLAVSIGFASFIVVAGSAVVHESLTMGDFTALLTILKSFSSRVRDIVKLTISIQRGLVNLKRVIGVLNLPDRNEEDKAMAEMYFNQHVLQRYHEAGLLDKNYKGYKGNDNPPPPLLSSTGSDIDTHAEEGDPAAFHTRGSIVEIPVLPSNIKALSTLQIPDKTIDPRDRKRLGVGDARKRPRKMQPRRLSSQMNIERVNTMINFVSKPVQITSEDSMSRQGMCGAAVRGADRLSPIAGHLARIVDDADQSLHHK